MTEPRPIAWRPHGPLMLSIFRITFSSLKKSRKPILIHAEDSKCLEHHTKKEKSLTDHHNSRPPLCETLAIQHILKTANHHSPPIHICHVSSKEGLHLLSNRPSHITFGVTPHHVLLSIDTITQPESWYKVNPPLRPSLHSQALFQGLVQEQIDIVESDHAPHDLSEKTKTFEHTPAGIPGVETMFPLFLYLASKQHISFQQVISLLCTNPAKLLHVPKGEITPGNDADFIVVDQRNIKKITTDNLHSKAKWTPFLQKNAIFPSDVFIRGQHVLNSYETTCSPGNGRYVEDKNYQND